MKAPLHIASLPFAALLALPRAAASEPSLSLSLVGPEYQTATALGPVHLAGPGPHPIPIAIRGVPGTRFSLAGELFRRLSTTAAPLASFNWKEDGSIPPSGQLLLQPELSFPESKTPSHYVARFEQTGFPPILIVSHPLGYLDPLKTLAQNQPLRLVGASNETSAVLREAGLKVEVVEPAASPPEDGSIVLWFSASAPPLEPPKRGRLILPDLSEPGREVWKRTAGQGWTIHLHPTALAPGRLSTTAGLVHLVELTTSDPNP